MHLNDKTAQVVDNLKARPIRSVVIIGLFIVYLPIVYQVHLNIVAAQVGTDASGYFWNNQRFTLFPLPIDASWISMGYTQAILPLTPMEE